MKKIGVICLCGCGVLLLVVLFVLPRFSKPASETKEETTGGCDYCNGEVLEIGEDYLIMKPTDQWQWGDAQRVRIPATTRQGDAPYEKSVDTPLYDGKFSELKVGDQIRVAFNSQTLERSGEEVLIRVVFALFRWSENR